MMNRRKDFSYKKKKLCLYVLSISLGGFLFGNYIFFFLSFCFIPLSILGYFITQDHSIYYYYQEIKDSK